MADMDQTRDRNDAETPSQRPSFFALTSFVGLAAAVIFVGFPWIDFAVTNLFHVGDQAFIWNFPGAGKDLRQVFKIVFAVAVAASFIGLILAAFFHRSWLTLDFQKWLFLVLCLVLGPGLTANMIFKETWGRARPFHVQEYGGTQTFTPALVRADQCESNCSFVSGEASALYMLFFALALLSKRRRTRLIAVGVAAGTLAGIVRIAQGGHFLSDVVFAGVFMALVARLLYWAVFEIGRAALADEGPVHTRLAEAGQSASATVRDRIVPAMRDRAARLRRGGGTRSDSDKDV